MKTSLVYVMSAAVLAVSFSAAYFLPIESIYKSLVAVPGVSALCLTLYKSWRDEWLQNRQQDFILGTASHMAQVAYDKHVIFCEEYIERVEKGRQELFAEGVSRNALTIGRELVNIRQKHAAWLTKEIEDSLKPFEQALIMIGAKNNLIDKLKIGEQRNKVIQEVYRAFGLVLGHETSLTEEEAKLHIDKVIENIRDILGINTLTKLRLKVSELALQRLDTTR